MVSYLDNLEKFYPRNRDEWHEWLKENHETSPGIWVIFYKKNSGKPVVSYDDAVEEALSFGWIDSKANSLDDERYLQVFTPRKPGSNWSKLNKDRVLKLTKQGRMQPAGLKKVEAAKKDGSWTFLNNIDALIMPEDFKLEIEINVVAAKNYQAFSDSIKKQILYWIATAKREDTRKRRIRKIIKSAENNENPFIKEENRNESTEGQYIPSR